MKLILAMALVLSMSQAFAQGGVSAGSTGGSNGSNGSSGSNLNQPVTPTSATGTTGGNPPAMEKNNKMMKAHTDCGNLQGKAHTNCMNSNKVKK